ncbi:MAG TPA: hypothetical protein VFO31_07125, partial [Vicinamibacterales bacterium]|nr:hypothetical protein [Vicinamibacterales bacterium]
MKAQGSGLKAQGSGKSLRHHNRGRGCCSGGSGLPRERPAALGTQLYQSEQDWAARQKQVSGGIRQYLGDSRARWEGDELVVETTNLTDKTSIGGNGNGLRHSDKMVITERFKRV